MKFVYRFTVTPSGRRRAEVYDSKQDSWRVVGLKAALSVIASGRGVERK